MARMVNILLLVISVGYSSAAAQAPTPTPSHCRGDEQLLFNCLVTNSAKIISLCGAKSLDHRRGYLQYRYGRPGAVELQFPQARANTQLAFRYAHYFRAQVERTEISFDHLGYRYTIFDYHEGDVTPALAVAGVRIGKHGSAGQATELQCQAKPMNKLASLETIIPRDHDNPLNR